GIAFVIGVFFGVIAGFTGGWIDTLIMRFVDAMLSFPALVLAIALAAAFGPSLENAMIAVAITLAPQFARVARSQALA
ncbi:ABC transporter permease subunit, partial [Staphylococcus pasteuri_A]